MNTSLQTLLTGAIDYAGTFPPAALSLGQAATNYGGYRGSADSWLLGRFVCKAEHLPELSTDLSGPLSVVMENAAAIKKAAAAVRARSIEAFELRSCGDIEDALAIAANLGVGQATLFVEMPSSAEPGQFAESLVVANRHAANSDFRAGLKIRTGGTTADAAPTTKRLADVIVACRDYGLFWKATAGLHQPLRHVDAATGTAVHGFLNLFAAAVLADARTLPQHEVQAILDDGHAENFRFTEIGLAWCDTAASIAEIEAARCRGLRSFGSCSFSEPLEGLLQLFGTAAKGDSP